MQFFRIESRLFEMFQFSFMTKKIAIKISVATELLINRCKLFGKRGRKGPQREPKWSSHAYSAEVSHRKSNPF